MFTLHGWDPNIQRARDWLAERLRQTYPLFAGRQGAGVARGMIEQGRIAVILDGLDEIPGDLRPAVLRALSQQATFRLVLLTRSAEMADAAARAVLQGAAAIELQDIDPDVAADYLTRTQLDPPPRGWQELTSRLRQEPGSPLARALSNPLMLTLVRDTYRAADDVGELLGLRDAAGHPASSEDIGGHLLDRVLPAAYTAQPGEPPPRYDLATAERTLRRIATRMNQDGTRDLLWWHAPAWAHAAPRFIATWFGAALAVGLSFGLWARAPVRARVRACGRARGRDRVRLRKQDPQTDGAGAVAAAVPAQAPCGGPPGWARGRELVRPFRPGRHRIRRAWGAGRARDRARGRAPGRARGLARGRARRRNVPAGNWQHQSPWPTVFMAQRSSVRTRDRTRSRARVRAPLGLVFWFVAGFTFRLSSGLSFGLGAGLGAGLVIGLVTWLVAGLVVGLVYPQTWSSSLAFAQLAVSDRTPIRLLRFLEDARSRSVLRRSGRSTSSATPGCKIA